MEWPDSLAAPRFAGPQEDRIRQKSPAGASILKNGGATTSDLARASRA